MITLGIFVILNPSSIVSEALLSNVSGFESEGVFHQHKDRYFYISSIGAIVIPFL